MPAKQRVYPRFQATSEEVQRAFRQAFDYIFQLDDKTDLHQPIVTNSFILIDLHVNKKLWSAGIYELGSMFVEHDRRVVYVNKKVDEKHEWVYIAGAMPGAFTDMPTDLGLLDAGFRFDCSDYLHVWLWNGLSWTFAPGDPGSKFIVPSPMGGPPNGGLWKLCDGTAADVAQSNGTLASVTTPDLTGGVFPIGDTFGAARVATEPTWQPGAKTATEATHTHPITPGSEDVQADGTTVDTCPVATGAGDAHSHDLGADAKLNPPSESAGGLPLRQPLQWYMRR